MTFSKTSVEELGMSTEGIKCVFKQFPQNYY